MNILVPLAEGFEEIEAITTLAVLKRAKMNAVTVGLPGTMVKSARDLKFIADKKLEDVKPEEFDAIVLVGGNSSYLSQSQKILRAIQDLDSRKKVIAAINTAPLILAKAGIIENRKATIYPGMEREIPRPRGERVVVDGHVITSQGPGTAIEFALKIVEALEGPAKARKLREELVA